MRYAIAKLDATASLDVEVLNDSGQYLVCTIAKDGNPASRQVLMSTPRRPAALDAANRLVIKLRKDIANGLLLPRVPVPPSAKDGKV